MEKLNTQATQSSKLTQNTTNSGQRLQEGNQFSNLKKVTVSSMEQQSNLNTTQKNPITEN